MLINEEEIGDVVGVDIEHTTKIGFDGKICLIQLKFKSKIFVLDAFKLSSMNADFSGLKQFF